jgi:hypothetical protein
MHIVLNNENWRVGEYNQNLQNQSMFVKVDTALIEVLSGGLSMVHGSGAQTIHTFTLVPTHYQHDPGK